MPRADLLIPRLSVSEPGRSRESKSAEGSGAATPAQVRELAATTLGKPHDQAWYEQEFDPTPSVQPSVGAIEQDLVVARSFVSKVAAGYLQADVLTPKGKWVVDGVVEKLEGWVKDNAEDLKQATPEQRERLAHEVGTEVERMVKEDPNGFWQSEQSNFGNPGEVQVADPRRHNYVTALIRCFPEAFNIAKSAGGHINLMGQLLHERLPHVRDQAKRMDPGKGVTVDPRTKSFNVVDIPNPDSPDGKWDPYQYMPKFVFDKKEDAFPISPDFDGDGDVRNNGPSRYNTKDGNYNAGRIGGRQPLRTAFSVTEKGGYTVLTYQFYYAHNKGTNNYHTGDYSTAQVFLQKGASGKLEPKHLYTSWHQGGSMAEYKDLELENGRPVIEVELGSHATVAIPKGHKYSKDGLQISGDGSVKFDGSPMEGRLDVDAFQTNVHPAKTLEPGTPEARCREWAMRWGEAAVNPLLPDEFGAGGGGMRPGRLPEIVKRGFQKIFS